MKNFADTSVLSKLPVGIGETAESNQSIVLDVANVLEIEDKQRVDAINNFDLVRDFATRNDNSKFLTLKNKTLTVY